jgi:hypothetical protein
LIVALTIGTAYLLSNVARADAGADGGNVPLQLGSAPSGAAVWLDGHQQGITPVSLSVAPGAHSVLLKASNAIDAQYALNVGPGGQTFDAFLWHRVARVTHLRPTLPGATLSDVRLLDSGALGLAVSLPPGRQIEAWSLDPRTGAVQLLMGTMPGAQLAFAADGRHLAFVGSEVGPQQPRDSNTWYASSSTSSSTPNLNVVWLFDAGAGIAAPGTGWRAPLESTEQLVDLSWSPHADRLLAVASKPLPDGASRSRAWFVDADGQHAEAAFTLPSDIAPGTAAWSPDGMHVAFIAHAGAINALCLLGVDGTFGYLADVDPSANLPLAYPPLSWSADGQRMVFVAPRQHPPGAAFDWLAPATQHAVFAANVYEAAPTALADTPVDQVAWREDGQLLGLWRAGPDAPLGVRLLDSSGLHGQDLLQLPLKPGSSYGSTWDLPHAELLVTSHGESGTNDYWLVRLGAEDDK